MKMKSITQTFLLLGRCLAIVSAMVKGIEFQGLWGVRGLWN